MARGTQHRKRRPQTNAGVAARTAGPPPKPKRPAYEEQLFFGRLRNHAKSVFVVLAAVFVLSFVFLGVGSGSTGISQIVSNFFSGTSAIEQVARLAAEADRRASEERRGLARLRQQAPAGQQVGRGGDGAHDVHDAPAQGHRPAQHARRRSTFAAPRTGTRVYQGQQALHADADARIARRAEVDLGARQGARDRDEPARERGLGPDLDDDEQRLPAGPQLPQPAPRRSTRRSVQLEPKDATTQLELAQAARMRATRRPRSRPTGRSSSSHRATRRLRPPGRR